MSSDSQKEKLKQIYFFSFQLNFSLLETTNLNTLTVVRYKYRKAQKI